MPVTATIAVAQSLVPQGAPDTVTLVFSGAGAQKIASVGWLSRPPYWSALESLIGLTCVNGASGRLKFNAIFESAGTIYDSADKVVTQSVEPYVVLDDGSVVVPASPSDLPPISPAYSLGTNPPIVVAVPTTTANIYVAGGTNFMDLNNTATWVALGN